MSTGAAYRCHGVVLGASVIETTGKGAFSGSKITSTFLCRNASITRRMPLDDKMKSSSLTSPTVVVDMSSELRSYKEQYVCKQLN